MKSDVVYRRGGEGNAECGMGLRRARTASCGSGSIRLDPTTFVTSKTLHGPSSWFSIFVHFVHSVVPILRNEPK